jgi:hypothetical protein
MLAYVAQFQRAKFIEIHRETATAKARDFDSQLNHFGLWVEYAEQGGGQAVTRPPPLWAAVG